MIIDRSCPEIMPDEAKAAGARIKVELRGSSTNIMYLR